MPVIAEIGRSKSLERLECGHGVLTPRGGRVVQFTVRATSFVFKMTVVVAVVLFALVLVMVLPLLLTDAYSQVSWPLLYGAIFAFLSQLSSLGKGEPAEPRARSLGWLDESVCGGRHASPMPAGPLWSEHRVCSRV